MDSGIREALEAKVFDTIIRCRPARVIMYEDALALLTAEPEPCITIERESDKEIIVNGDPNQRIKKGSTSNKVVDVKSNSSPMQAEPEPCEEAEKIALEICNDRTTYANGAKRISAYATQVADKRAEKLREQVETLREALSTIEAWGPFPETGRHWPTGEPMSYKAAYGSNGTRDFMRGIARKALAATEPKHSAKEN